MDVRTRGFTLYELLVTLGLVAILVALAVPSFAGTIARQRQQDSGDFESLRRWQNTVVFKLRQNI